MSLQVYENFTYIEIMMTWFVVEMEEWHGYESF